MSLGNSFHKTLHIFALFGFAVAQPLFDLLSRNADFLVAHDLRPADLLILVCILSLLLPGLFVLVEVFAGLLHHRLAESVHGLIVSLLVTAVALQAFKKLLDGPGLALVTGAGVVGLLAGWTSLRMRPLQTFLTFLSPSVLLFPALFLLRPPVSGLLFPERKQHVAREGVLSDTPIVLIVFDELPTSTLMNEHLETNAFRYPNFAALARDSQWFRNASTVAESTRLALPAILTGRYPNRIVPGIAANYPENLFTWLGGEYELNVFETVTRICPEKLCSETIAREGFRERIRTTLSDLWFIYLHATFPVDMTQDLPPVTMTMRDFGVTSRAPKGATAEDMGRRSRDYSWVFSQFVNCIQPADGPVLYFLHTLVTHIPYAYLPSGKQYGPTELLRFPHGVIEGTWTSDEWETTQGFQRHLLQAQYADRLLGTVLARLHEVALYDRSLIIVTADHGVSFWPDNKRRQVTQKNGSDTHGVPLFVKVPYQRKAVVSDRNVEIIDILPTIADVLDAEIRWAVDGQSALDHLRPERSQKLVFRKVRGNFPTYIERLVFSPELEGLEATVKRKMSLFGSGEDPRDIYRIGRFRSLIGAQTAHLAHVEALDMEIELEGDSGFDEVALDGAFIPALVSGQIYPERGSPNRLHLAVAVNGTIRAVTQTYRGPKGGWSFTAIVPEWAFREGANQVEVFVVSDSQGHPQLISAGNRRRPQFSLLRGVSPTCDEFINSWTGETIRIVPGAMDGAVDLVRQLREPRGHISIFGGASDGAHRKPAERVVVFVDDETNHDGHTVISRKDIARGFQTPSLEQAGFHVILPVSVFERNPLPVVRVFAISSTGVASELQYRREYPDGSRKRRLGNAARAIRYSLARSGDGLEQHILSSTGETIRIVPAVMGGAVDRVRQERRYTRISGWASDGAHRKPAAQVAVFVDGEADHYGHTTVPRRELAEAFKAPSLVNAGFQVAVPGSIFDRAPPPVVRVVAISSTGVASELSYRSEYKDGPQKRRLGDR